MVDEPRKGQLGDLLRSARKALGFDQAALADKLGVSTRNVSRWETEIVKPSHEVGQQIVEALREAPADLVSTLANALGVGMLGNGARPSTALDATIPAKGGGASLDPRARFDALVYGASEERDVLPRHLRAFGVELLMAVDRAGLTPREAAAFVAARERDKKKPEA